MEAQLQQRLLFSSSIVLIILLVFTFLYSVWQWRSDWQLTHQEIEVATMPVEKITMENIVTSIADAHLFGQAPQNLAVNEVPISSLQLKVTGIIKLTQQSKASKVLISTAGQPSRVYKIGDEVANGVKIYDITEDTVILENNGRYEKLPLVREKLQFKPRMREGM